VNKKALSWVGVVLFLGLVNIAAAAPAAGTPIAKKRTAPRAAASSARHSTAYSAARSQTRKAKLARARAVATAREMASTVLPRYKTDDSGALVPDLRAEAAVIYDPETNKVLWEQNAQAQRSIASITKVMTATVFLENDPDLSQQVSIVRSDVFQASTTHLRFNDKVTTDDLLHLLLIASDNAAARALARVSPYGTDGFVRRMNEKAAELGLVNTSYADPSGLLSDNVSSAYDMARLITHASQDERIASIMRTQEYTIRTAKNRVVPFRSTDRLLGSPDVDVRAAKTGFISKAGYCLATLLRMPQGSQVAVVVLGARSNAARFLETKNLFQWMSTQASSLLSAAPAPAAPAPQAQIQ
jgi:D-alanyl-D-alanine endopeptidase (penicillin-binding protein 7)